MSAFKRESPSKINSFRTRSIYIMIVNTMKNKDSLKIELKKMVDSYKIFE